MYPELSFKDTKVLIITYTTLPYYNNDPKHWEYTITPLTKKQLKQERIDSRSYSNLKGCVSHGFGQDYLEGCVRIK